jgi:O-antigen/teichoic acid export membrane protein
MLSSNEPRLDAGSGSIVAHTLKVLSARVVSVLMTLLASVVIARSIGPRGQGIYAATTFIALIAIAVAGLGIPWSNQAFAGRRGYVARSLAANSYVFVLAAAAIAAVLGSVTFLAPRAWLPIPGDIALLVVVWIPFGVAVDALAGLTWGLNRMVAWSRIFIVLGPLATLAALLIFSIVLHLGVKGAVLAWLVGQIAMLIAGSWTLRRVLYPPGAVDGKVLRESLPFGFRSVLSNLLGTLNLRFDFLLVLSFLGAAQLGIYAVAVMLTQLVLFLPSATAASLLPVFSSGEKERVVALTNGAVRANLTLSVIAGLVLALAAPAVLWIFGHEYLSGLVTLLILLPGTVLYSIAHITTAYWQTYRRRPQINLYLAGMSLTIDVIAAIILVPRFGLPGAALAASLSYTASVIVSLSLYIRDANVSLRDVITFRRDDLAGVVEAFRRSRRQLTAGSGVRPQP